METPQSRNDNAILVPNDHWSVNEIVDVWKKLFGANAWLKGCLPFKNPVRKHMDPQVVLVRYVCLPHAQTTVPDFAQPLSIDSEHPSGCLVG
ncbi:hypothetical protein F5B21DRAFT_438015 [Xylaria acuta]|nr:hypothetical protein F5B21DRAFT_438015 [Xylaria acuta]